MKHMYRAAVIALVLAAPGAAARAADRAPDGFEGELEVILTNALFYGDTPEGKPARLTLHLERRDGKWRDVWGSGYNRGIHTGLVEQAAVGPDGLRLELGMLIGGDRWLDGGGATYTVEAKSTAPGRFEGTFQGQWRGSKVSGPARAWVKPPRPMRVEGFVPLKSGEHPRILFRKHELEDLKAKLRTPLGRAYLERAKASDDLVSLGMLYQLTGERQYADRAKGLIEAFGGNIAPGGQGAGTGGVGHRFVTVALAYDLCLDAWPEAFRQKLAKEMAHMAHIRQVYLAVAGANYDPCSNFYGPATGSAAINTLALYGDAKGPAPKRPDELAGALARKLGGGREQDVALRAWQIDRREWEETNAADPGITALFLKARRQMHLHYRIGVGDGGFQAETGAYADIGSWYPLVYAAAHRRIFGRDVSAYPDITHLVPRRMMQVVFREGGKDLVQKINSVAGFRPQWCAAAFPLAPAAWQPAMLWAWNRAAGVTDAASIPKILGEGRQNGLYLAHAFVNYPLKMKPAHPGQVMPLTWQAPTLGFYCFRSGWQGRDEFISQVFVKASRIRGWNHPNAGTFRVLGFGHTWVVGSNDRLGFREQEPVVLLPADRHDAGACGTVTFLAAGPDGSGGLTIDLHEVYARRDDIPEARALAPMAARRGPVQIDVSRLRPTLLPRPKQEPITGLRAVAFDYSGLSGSPCLIALVDRIRGGKQKEWRWQVAQEGTKEALLPQVRIDGATFALDYGDASLKGHFAAPPGVQVAHHHKGAVLGSPGGRQFVGGVRCVTAAGGDDFFLVATVQRGDPPPARIEGRGLDAKVTIGRRTVRFDGEKIVFGP